MGNSLSQNALAPVTSFLGNPLKISNLTEYNDSKKQIIAAILGANFDMIPIVQKTQKIENGINMIESTGQAKTKIEKDILDQLNQLKAFIQQSRFPFD